MNVSTKTWLLELLDRGIEFNRTELASMATQTFDYQIKENELARINDARRLVEQGPEDPRR
jgi:hypothetical protein